MEGSEMKGGEMENHLINRNSRSESVVYSWIKNIVTDDLNRHRFHNRDAMQALPSAETWSLVNREMFSLHDPGVADFSLNTEVVHFGRLIKEWNMSGDAGLNSLSRCCVRCIGSAPRCIWRLKCPDCTVLFLPPMGQVISLINRTYRFAVSG